MCAEVAGRGLEGGDTMSEPGAESYPCYCKVKSRPFWGGFFASTPNGWTRSSGYIEWHEVPDASRFRVKVLRLASILHFSC